MLKVYGQTAARCGGKSAVLISHLSQSRRTFIASSIVSGMGSVESAKAETQELTSLTLKKASELLRSKSLSAVELTEACLRRIEKLNAGAIILGKLNMHEFAYGATSAVSYFGAVHNPWMLERISGGSSGGSAAAIASDLCFGTLGTDTGGLIRIPSSDCGTVGLMPTYGRVSNRGVIPMAWTLDHVGPICKTVEDAAIMLGVIAGYDSGDLTTRYSCP